MTKSYSKHYCITLHFVDPSDQNLIQETTNQRICGKTNSTTTKKQATTKDKTTIFTSTPIVPEGYWDCIVLMTLLECPIHETEFVMII